MGRKQQNTLAIAGGISLLVLMLWIGYLNTGSPVVERPVVLPTQKPVELRYDPQGPDRDCGDFTSRREAMAFFIAAGGPEKDPHWLDADADGIPCERLR